MIGKLSLKRFKCFKNQDICFRNLTILAGRNGSGKSSVTQALRCVKALLEDSTVLDLRKLGIGVFADIYYQFNQSGEKRIELELDGSRFAFDYKDELAGKDQVKPGVVQGSDLRPSDEFKHAIANMRYLKADRIGPRSVHEDSSARASARDLGENGEYAISYLSRHSDDRVCQNLVIQNARTRSCSPDLLNQVSAWLQGLVEGVTVVAEPLNDDTHVKLSFEFGDDRTHKPFRPENVGVGLSRVLPILILILSSTPGDLLVIENPETDLHPRGQSAMTELFARAAAAGIQMIVETHSDHIVNGLRLAVKRSARQLGLIKEDQINIIFFKRVIDTVTHEQFSDVCSIHIDSEGELTRRPNEFLDEWGRTLDSLLDVEVDGDDSNKEG